MQFLKRFLGQNVERKPLFSEEWLGYPSKIKEEISRYIL